MRGESYHTFADRRTLIPYIPNTLNVLSNLPFLVVGSIGAALCSTGGSLTISSKGERWSWFTFFIGILAVAFGSTYYHLHPNDTRLVWDRLPMTVAFMSVMAICIIERVHEHHGNMSLLSLVGFGALSVLYWRLTDDLRPYLLVQFVPVVSVPTLILCLPHKYSHSVFWLWAAGWYVLAKLAELFDRKIYRLTHFSISGHTLKHLLAALVPVCVLYMLAQRAPVTDRQAPLQTWLLAVRGENHALVDEANLSSPHLADKIDKVNSD
eukprot:SM000076S21786  [mRNA]  locus=s76:188094:190486:+ [translate_table: standard]